LTKETSSKKKAIVNGVIPEEENEYGDEQSDQEQLDKDIKDFLKNSRLHMQRHTHLGQPLQKSEKFLKREE
jgi:hypothetical protein